MREDKGGWGRWREREREGKRRGIKWFQHRHALGVLNRCCCAETVKRAATPFWNRLLAASTRPKRFVLRVYVCEREACARSVSVCKRAARFDCTAKRGRSGRGGYFETSRETKREFHPEVMRGQNCTAFLILWYGCPPCSMPWNVASPRRRSRFTFGVKRSLSASVNLSGESTSSWIRIDRPNWF